MAHGADKAKNDALMAAIRNDDESMAILLIRNGIQIEEDGDREATPLFEAAQNGLVKVVKELLSIEANVNWIADRGTSVLMAAVFKGHTNIVRMLLEAGADPTLVNSFGESALTIAQQNEHQEIIKLLESVIQSAHRIQRTTINTTAVT